MANTPNNPSNAPAAKPVALQAQQVAGATPSPLPPGVAVLANAGAPTVRATAHSMPSAFVLGPKAQQARYNAPGAANMWACVLAVLAANNGTCTPAQCVAAAATLPPGTPCNPMLASLAYLYNHQRLAAAPGAAWGNPGASAPVAPAVAQALAALSNPQPAAPVAQPTAPVAQPTAPAKAPAKAKGGKGHK